MSLTLSNEIALPDELRDSAELEAVRKKGAEVLTLVREQLLQDPVAKTVAICVSDCGPGLRGLVWNHLGGRGYRFKVRDDYYWDVSGWGENGQKTDGPYR